MEKHILSSVLRSRDNYELIRKHINIHKNPSKEKKYSREFVILLENIGEYYGRDKEVDHIDLPLMRALLESGSLNERHVERLYGILEEAAALDTSASNVNEVVLQMKRGELALELAIAIQNGQPHTELVDEYSTVLKETQLEGLLEKGTEVYRGDDIETLLASSGREGLLTVYPLALNERLDGGLGPQDHVTVFARPEQGKTALLLTIAAGFARQGAPGIYFSNEESVHALRSRLLSCATTMTRREILANTDAARDIAEQVGLENVHIISMSPGSPTEIEYYVEKYGAKWFIVDQIRHLLMRSENRTTQLEAAANAVRNIAKRHNAIGISVTQAGDSAEGKAVLGMGDCDSSNTGIPGACDVMLGIGSTEEQNQSGIRVLSLCKNKISGRHENFPVRFNPLLSKYVSADASTGE